MSVQTTRQPQSPQSMPGTQRVASTIAGTVVTSSSSMIRGFVSAMYARIRPAVVGGMVVPVPLVSPVGSGADPARTVRAA